MNNNINTIKFSYSNVNTFETCPYAWKLTYLDKITKREPNAFAEFGTFLHEIMEMWFLGKLDIFDVGDYYKENYHSRVVTPFPPYPKGMAENYYDYGIEFLDGLDFDKDNYELVSTEEYIDYNINDLKLVVKPDIILGDKINGGYILMDYKTANPRKQNGKLDQDKIDGYLKQLRLYSFYIEKVKKIKISKLFIWFIRGNEKLFYNYLDIDGNKTNEWFKSVISKIKAEKKFQANPSNKYFCDNLCGARSICEFRK